MHVIPLDLCKCPLLIVIPPYFHECAPLIVKTIFCWKPDDSDRNLMTQMRSLSISLTGLYAPQSYS